MCTQPHTHASPHVCVAISQLSPPCSCCLPCIPRPHTRCLIEIPYILAQAALYSVVTYFMIQFEFDAAKFFWWAGGRRVCVRVLICPLAHMCFCTRAS